MTGTSSSRHCFIRGVGMGSRPQLLSGDFVISSISISPKQTRNCAAQHPQKRRQRADPKASNRDQRVHTQLCREELTGSIGQLMTRNITKKRRRLRLTKQLIGDRMDFFGRRTVGNLLAVVLSFGGTNARTVSSLLLDEYLLEQSNVISSTDALSSEVLALRPSRRPGR